MSSFVFSADSLFGPPAPAYSLLGRLPFLEHADREQDETRAGIALTAFAVGRLIARWLARGREAGVGIDLPPELKATQVRLRELPPADAEVGHLTRIVDALDVADAATAALGNYLLAYAAYLEQEARVEEALDAVALATRAYGTGIAAGDFAVCALTAGRLNRLLARWEAAATCYEAAEVTGREHGDVVFALRGRLGRGAVARGRGNLPAARAIAEEVQQDAIRSKLPQVQALACADLAAAYSELGMPIEALQADYEAFRLTQDPAQRMRTLGNVGTDLVHLRSYDAARTAFTIVARSDAKATVRLNAVLELMGIEAAVGDRTAFERHRRAAARYRDQMPPSMAVDFLFKAASGLSRFGQLPRARAALCEAQAVAEKRGLHAWEFRVEQALRTLGTGLTQPLPAATATTPPHSTIVRDVAVGLQEYAAASR